ncbi:MAG: PAS domain S-box protein [Spirochaetota bacterium]
MFIYQAGKEFIFYSRPKKVNVDKQNVLIVEDEPLIALDIKKTLEEKGYEVVGISANGTDALAMAADYKPDIVLMDIMLDGDMDGIETSMRLREQVNPAIIYVTANTNKDILSKAITTNPYGYLNKPVNEIDLLATIHTALNTHTLQQQLVESESRYRQLFNRAADAMFIHDFDGNFLQVNDAACEKLGYTREELCSMNIRDIDTPEYQHLVPERIEHLHSQGSSFFATSHIHKEGYTIPVELHSILINYEGCQRVMSTARDISRRKKLEHSLESTREKFKNIVDLLPQLVAYTDRNLVYRFINKRYLSFFNTEETSIVGKKLPDVIGDNAYGLAEKHVTRALDGEHVEYLEHYDYNNAGPRYMDGKLIPDYADDGTIEGYFAILTDITSHIHDMEIIKRSLGEKNALLKEIHHRVKNNFQIISSLINYQVNTTSDPVIKDILCDIQNRIFAMATIHEKFYSSESCSSIDFSRFAKTITDELCHSCVTGTCDLIVQYDLDPVLLGLDESIPLGLILNEAVSNTLKHAFTETSQAHKTLSISLKESSTRMVHCTISDNGIGIPEDVDINNPVNFGLSLLHLLSRQLDARITISSEKGTNVEVIFSKKQAHPRSL